MAISSPIWNLGTRNSEFGVAAQAHALRLQEELTTVLRGLARAPSVGRGLGETTRRTELFSVFVGGCLNRGHLFGGPFRAKEDLVSDILQWV